MRQLVVTSTRKILHLAISHAIQTDMLGPNIRFLFVNEPLLTRTATQPRYHKK